MAYCKVLFLDARSNLFTLRVALEQRYDVTVMQTKDTAQALEQFSVLAPDYIVVNPESIDTEVNNFLAQLTQTSTNTPVIAVGQEGIVKKLRLVYPYVTGRVPPRYSENDLMPFLQRGRPTETGKLRSMALAERAALVQSNQALEQRLREMMTLYQIGRSVASLTDLDAILGRIVEAVVYLLRSEESSIMLVDPKTKKLYLRAEKGLGEKRARGFNLQIQDTLIGSVVQTGKPVRMGPDSSSRSQLKVVTGYLVNALLYVPLILRGQVIGVLGAANQTKANNFSEHDQRLMSALADYAALAIEVVRQHQTIVQLQRSIAVAPTIIATVQELRRYLNVDDQKVLSALERIEKAAQVLNIQVTQKSDPGV